MGQDRAKGQGKDFTTFGWYGITLTVPSDWERGAQGGDDKSGFARLADENSVRLEMRWQQAPRDQEASRAVTKHIEELQKKARKQRVSLPVRRDLNLANPKGKDVECYQWTAERQALGMVSCCRECGRLVQLYVLGEPEQPLKKLARAIFASLQDHAESGRLVWRLYG